MKKTLLVFAAEWEAAETFKLFSIIPQGLQHFYPIENGYILITGYGMLAASSFISRYAHLSERILNFGIAGSLNDKLLIGSMREVNLVSKHLSIPEYVDEHSHNLAKRTFPDIPLDVNGVALISSNYPIFHSTVRSQLALKSDLVDMEGYAIAWVAKQLQKECRMWKLVSDLASPEGWLQIMKHKETLSQQLANQVKYIMEN
ncbi:MAG: hypothetical protein K0S74_338 [Chlamydiales bacterium]|jgi:adenosylhomocysteine nucleosidase|nr:hypothetical protein [Chlamydiales bacterium]